MEIAEAAARATDYGDPEVLSALAAAYGEDGFFLQAGKFAEDAEALARENGLDVIAEEAGLRLRAFEEKRAFRRERLGAEEVGLRVSGDVGGWQDVRV